MDAFGHHDAFSRVFRIDMGKGQVGKIKAIGMLIPQALQGLLSGKLATEVQLTQRIGFDVSQHRNGIPHPLEGWVKPGEPGEHALQGRHIANELIARIGLDHLDNHFTAISKSTPVNLPNAGGGQGLIFQVVEGALRTPDSTPLQQSLEVFLGNGRVLAVELTEMKAFGGIEEINPQGMHLA